MKIISKKYDLILQLNKIVSTAKSDMELKPKVKECAELTKEMIKKIIANSNKMS